MSRPQTGLGGREVGGWGAWGPGGWGGVFCRRRRGAWGRGDATSQSEHQKRAFADPLFFSIFQVVASYAASRTLRSMQTMVSTCCLAALTCNRTEQIINVWSLCICCCWNSYGEGDLCNNINFR